MSETQPPDETQNPAGTDGGPDGGPDEAAAAAPVPDRAMLYSAKHPGGKLFEGEDAVREALESGFVDHPKKIRGGKRK